MRRRRKNAGKGFGMMFHGAFADKKSAKRKEKQVHGFIQPRNIKGQRRFVVMSERKNPIRRKKNAYLSRESLLEIINRRDRRDWTTLPMSFQKDAVKAAYRDIKRYLDKNDVGARVRASKALTFSELRSAISSVRDNTYIPGANPMDLVVMGANPKGETQQQLRDRIWREYLEKVRKQKEGEQKEAEKHPRYRRMGERNPEIVVHPGQTITLKVNPSAEAIREDFVGELPNKMLVYHEPHMPDGDYAKLGDLMGISYKPIAGGQVQAIGYYQGSDRIPLLEAAKKSLKLTDEPKVVSDETRRQIYFVAGLQDLDPMLEMNKLNPADKDVWELGEARHIVYRERKRFDQFQLINYVHRFGEETGEAPMLCYDARHKRLLLEGGDYEVRPEGIVN